MKSQINLLRTLCGTILVAKNNLESLRKIGVNCSPVGL